MPEELIGDRCPKCNGSKTMVVGVVDMKGLSVEIDCDECNGTGIVNSPNACTVCHGKKTVTVDMGGFMAEVGCEHCQGFGLEPK